MTDPVAIGRPSEFREGRGRVVVVAGVRVAVFRIGARLFALRDACPHMGLSLADGVTNDGKVTCRGHGWSFDLGTGRSDRRSGACAVVYDVWVDGDEVLVRPPTTPVEGSLGDEAWPAWDDERHMRRSNDAASDGAANGEERGGETHDDPDR